MLTNSFENKVSLSPWLLCVLVRFCNEFLTFVEINKLSCKSEGSACTHERSSFFRLGRKGGRGGVFGIFPCSQCVPIVAINSLMISHGQPMRQLNMHPRGPSLNTTLPCECTQGAQVFFLWGEGGGVGFFLIPLCSCQVHNGSQHVPNSSSLYPIFFAISSTLVTYISSPKEEHTTYLFWDYPKVDLFFCDGPIKDAHHTRGGCHNYLN
jgi:hypothetical protein